MRAVSNDHLKASSSAVASNIDELFDRTVWLVTEHHQYYFFVRNLAYMQLLRRELSANETEAMELWTLIETLEAEDVILRLRASLPKPELVAMILLMRPTLSGEVSEALATALHAKQKRRSIRCHTWAIMTVAMCCRCDRRFASQSRVWRRTRRESSDK